jgi:hypothetical protein
MFKKLAVALVAATMFTAPALAQGGTDAKTGATPAKVVTVHKSPKYAKVKHVKRYAARHHRHAKHVVHVKRVKYVRAATSPYAVKHHVHHVRHVAYKPSHRVYGAATTGAKPKSGTN